jgi:uncharacterized protein involved in outer membrane biogenesis
MKKILKYSAFGLGGLIGVVLIIVAIVAATFNPNDYKQEIVDLVQAKKNRTLKLDGDIKLAFWPKIGANLGKVSLSEHKGSAEFAAVDSVKVSLALLPLLKKELIVDTVYIDGVHANIVKYKDGTTNFDDLLSKEESKTIKFDIDGINVTNSAASYSDESTGAKYNITKLNLKSGHFALAEPVDLETDFVITANQPAIAANAKLKGNFLVDPDTKHYAAKGLDASIKGELLGGKEVNITASGDIDAKPETKEFLINSLKIAANGQFSGAKLTLNLSAPELKALKDEVTSKETTVSLIQEKGSDTFKANLVLADIKGSPKALQSSGVTGDISGVQGKRIISGKFSSPFSGNLENSIFDLPKLVGNLDIKDPALPNGGVKGSFSLSLHTDTKQELVDSKFDLSVDSTKLNGDVAVASFKKPNIKFNLIADTLDLNKLLGTSNQPADKAPANQKPTDLSFLKNLLLDGKIKIANLIYQKYRLSGLNLGIKADGEKLALTGLNVKLDDSQIKGNLAISQFAKPLYTFDIDIDKLDVDRYVTTNTSATPTASKASDKPLDLSALKALNADGSLRIGSLKYGKTKASNIRIDLKADGQKLSLNPLAAKVDDSQINANIGIARFNDPIYSFNVNIDKLDADKYITKNDHPTAKTTGETPIDLSALKKLNASGEAKIGWLKIANIKTENVNIGLKAVDGIATVSPFAANLYQGSMSGVLKVDARTIPIISFKQDMKGISIGPLLVDAINNDMLSGKGTLNVDITTTGNSVGALKKALAGNAAVNLADGAIKGVDIAGTLRDVKSKVNIFKDKSSIGADQSKKTDFSELTASFAIKNGVAHNDDLAMKAPILRLAKGDSRGDIDIGNETINYLAKPSVVKSLKGQGGADLDALAGFSIPVKITGTFSSPKYGMDFAAIGTAMAKSNLLDKVGGEKGAAVKDLIGGGDKVDALKGLLGKKKTTDTAAPANTAPSTTEAAPAEKPKSAEDQAKEAAAKKLKKLLNF